jgi:hypothetical protein
VKPNLLAVHRTGLYHTRSFLTPSLNWQAKQYLYLALPFLGKLAGQTGRKASEVKTTDVQVCFARLRLYHPKTPCLELTEQLQL